MNVILRLIDRLRPYEGNPRKNDQAVDAVAASIREFGFRVPLVITADGEIIAGHTRYKAAQKLGIRELPCVVADDLSEEQIKAFRLADNKTAELSDWNEELLAKELAEITNIDMSLFGFEAENELADDLEDDMYSSKVNVPQYEIKGEKPRFDQMLDTEKADSLIEEIYSSSVSEEEKEFLIQAARRHNVFDYGAIAEYYAQASPEMQRLMERSALVIIDIDNAIANGYTSLMQDVLEAVGDIGDA